METVINRDMHRLYRGHDEGHLQDQRAGVDVPGMASWWQRCHSWVSMAAGRNAFRHI